MSLIAHNDRVFSLPACLSPAECAELVLLAEVHGFESAGVRTHGGPRAMPQVRNNLRTVLAHPQWVARLWQRLPASALPTLGGQTAQGLPHELRFYKYLPGQRFKMHKDGPWHENGQTSQLTLLVYLNEGFAGGTTDFRGVCIQPHTGDALLFVHDTWHEGTEVTQGVKYVLRSDVLYG